MATDENIVFDPFTSRVESGFWHELGRRKLEKYKLSEAEQCIRGSYSNGESSCSFCLLEMNCLSTNYPTKSGSACIVGSCTAVARFVASARKLPHRGCGT